jgi:hypothetical protein
VLGWMWCGKSCDDCSVLCDVVRVHVRSFQVYGCRLVFLFYIYIYMYVPNSDNDKDIYFICHKGVRQWRLQVHPLF